MIRIALIMLGDRAAAEDVVQDAFFGLYRRWARLKDPDSALTYVRSAVLNGCCECARYGPSGAPLGVKRLHREGETRRGHGR
jgi:DNA-directed RNA polymerase specialized sigma24 family protein